MSARSARRQKTGDQMFPGMPDRVTGTPAKAGAEPEPLTLDEAITRSHDILDQVLDSNPVVATFGLFSGGNDSVIVNHLMQARAEFIVHVNTGTGIDATTQHVRDVARAWRRPAYQELHPRDSYEDLVLGKVLARTGPNEGRPVWKGFPGPGGSHRVMYRRLKDEPLQRLRREIVGKAWRTRRVVFLSGMRWAETDRRFRNAEEVDKDGSLIWVAPIVHWTDGHMREYRARYRCQENHEHAPHRLCFPGALPLNEVTEHLHMSGECLCGCFARPGELDEIEFFYGDDARRIRALEEKVAAAGIAACQWGQRPPGSRDTTGPAGRLCTSCVAQVPGQTDLAETWRDRGLITPEQYDRMRSA
jgi:3'-phosphoadenosine 5'-phosphosulfate sulfotransferase (PAPS reductase)/FAD synthetase